MQLTSATCPHRSRARSGQPRLFYRHLDWPRRDLTCHRTRSLRPVVAAAKRSCCYTSSSAAVRRAPAADGFVALPCLARAPQHHAAAGAKHHAKWLLWYVNMGGSTPPRELGCNSWPTSHLRARVSCKAVLLGRYSPPENFRSLLFVDSPYKPSYWVAFQRHWPRRLHRCLAPTAPAAAEPVEDSGSSAPTCLACAMPP